MSFEGAPTNSHYGFRRSLMSHMFRIGGKANLFHNFPHLSMHTHGEI